MSSARPSTIADSEISTVTVSSPRPVRRVSLTREGAAKGVRPPASDTAWTSVRPSRQPSEPASLT